VTKEKITRTEERAAKYYCNGYETIEDLEFFHKELEFPIPIMKRSSEKTHIAYKLSSLKTEYAKDYKLYAQMKNICFPFMKNDELLKKIFGVVPKKPAKPGYVSAIITDASLAAEYRNFLKKYPLASKYDPDSTLLYVKAMDYYKENHNV
jgi:hypothetical protein